MSASSSSWLARPRPVDRPRGRVLCIPHAGGGPSAYARWATHLDSDLDLCIASLPGRERRMREAPERDVAAVTAALASALDDLAEAPIVLFGHSFGSIIAFELARALRQRSRALPLRLFASACAPPDRVPVERLAAGRSDDELLAHVAARFDAIPREVLDEPELVALVLPAMRADFEMHDGYTFSNEAPLPIPIDSLGGTGDRALAPGSLDGWSAHTLAGHSVTLFDGGHFYVHEHAPAIARRLAASFDVPA